MDILKSLDLGTIAALVTAGLTVLSVVFGQKYAKYKKKAIMFIRMIEDGTVTKEELQKVVRNDDK